MGLIPETRPRKYRVVAHTGRIRDRQGVCGECRLRVVLGQHGYMEAMVIPVRTVSAQKVRRFTSEASRVSLGRDLKGDNH